MRKWIKVYYNDYDETLDERLVWFLTESLDYELVFTGYGPNEEERVLGFEKEN